MKNLLEFECAKWPSSFRTDGLPVPVREADLWPFPVP